MLNLKNQNVDLNEQNYDGRTPLHKACLKGNVKIIQFLLDQNIDVNKVDRWGSTPLDNANSREIHEMLVLRGAQNGSFEFKKDILPYTNQNDQLYRFKINLSSPDF